MNRPRATNIHRVPIPLGPRVGTRPLQGSKRWSEGSQDCAIAMSRDDIGRSQRIPSYATARRDRRRLVLERLERRCLFYGISISETEILESSRLADEPERIDALEPVQEFQPIDSPTVPAEDSQAVVDGTGLEANSPEIAGASCRPIEPMSAERSLGCDQHEASWNCDFQNVDAFFASDQSADLSENPEEQIAGCTNETGPTTLATGDDLDLRLEEAGDDFENQHSQELPLDPGQSTGSLESAAEEWAPIDKDRPASGIVVRRSTASDDNPSYFQPRSQSSQLNWTLRTEIAQNSLASAPLSVASVRKPTATLSNSRRLTEGLNTSLQVGAPDLALPNTEKRARITEASLHNRPPPPAYESFALRKRYRLLWQMGLNEARAGQLAEPQEAVDVILGEVRAASSNVSLLDIPVPSSTPVTPTVRDTMGQTMDGTERLRDNEAAAEAERGQEWSHVLMVIATTVGQLVIERRKSTSSVAAQVESKSA